MQHLGDTVRAAIAELQIHKPSTRTRGGHCSALATSSCSLTCPVFELSCAGKDVRLNELARWVASDLSIPYVDVAALSYLRADGAMGYNPWTRKEDCVHYCMPGVPDDFARLLFNVMHAEDEEAGGRADGRVKSGAERGVKGGVVSGVPGWVTAAEADESGEALIAPEGGSEESEEPSARDKLQHPPSPKLGDWLKRRGISGDWEHDEASRKRRQRPRGGFLDEQRWWPFKAGCERFIGEPREPPQPYTAYLTALDKEQASKGAAAEQERAAARRSSVPATHADGPSTLYRG